MRPVAAAHTAHNASHDLRVDARGYLQSSDFEYQHRLLVKIARRYADSGPEGQTCEVVDITFTINERTSPRRQGDARIKDAVAQVMRSQIHEE